MLDTLHLTHDMRKLQRFSALYSAPALHRLVEQKEYTTTNPDHRSPWHVHFRQIMTYLAVKSTHPRRISGKLVTLTLSCRVLSKARYIIICPMWTCQGLQRSGLVILYVVALDEVDARLSMLNMR